MGANATVLSTPLTVEPGGSCECHVTVHNDGSVVDAFRVEPLGIPGEWASVDPPELALMPGEQGVVTVTFAPPRTWSTTPGRHPFGLRVQSREDPASGTVEESEIEVAVFGDVGAVLAARTVRVRGRRHGRFPVALDNRGNAPTAVAVDALDPDGRLSVELPGLPVQVQPGKTSIVHVRARSRQGLWRGRPRQLPFSVELTADEATPLVLAAELDQHPVLPGWAWKALAAVAAVLALLVALWLLLLRPAIRDSATSAAQAASAKAAAAQNRKAAATTAGLQDQLDAVKGARSAPAAAAPAAAGRKAVASPPSTAPLDPMGDPTVTRVAATTTGQHPSAVLSKDRITSVTDLLLQNPAGDTGSVTVRRGGSTLYVARLENFRDLDLHLEAPLVFAPGDRLTLDVACENPGGTASPCSPAVTVSGFARHP